jgi:AcrR family transcriptional regulator
MSTPARRAAPRTPLKRKRERTADHLSATAFRLFEARGYTEVTMEQVAAEAGVAKATLYAHFPVKEALIAHRFREDIAAGMEQRATALAAHRSFAARMRYLLTESAEWHAARRAYLPAYLRYLTSRARYGDAATPGAEAIDNGGRRILALMFKAAQDSGELDTRHSADELAMSVESLLFGAVTAWLNDPRTDLSTRFLAAFDLALHGMVARTARTQSRKPRKGATP